MKHHARCHCERVRFSFRSAEITTGKRYNCSLCVRRGVVLSSSNAGSTASADAVSFGCW